MKPHSHAAPLLLSLSVLSAAAIGTAIGTTAAYAASPSQPAAGPAGMPVSPENAAIAVPDTVDPGQTVNVIVNGAPEGSRVELWGPVTQSGIGGQISSGALVGGVAALAAPTLSASYQIRYVSPGGAVLARTAFEVAAVPIALTVTTPMGISGEMRVRWQGPASAGDRFEIVDPSGTVLESTPVVGDPGAENVSTLTVPQARGPLELRYVTGGGSVLRSVGFDVR